MIPTTLERTTRDLDIHVAMGGWNQPTRLFAIAQTHQLLEREPGLAAQLSGTADESPWTTIEQDDLPTHSDLDDLLGGLGWPESVDGVAVSAERIMVSPQDAADQTQHEL
ncbi:MAG: PPA1309 family protein, partial [Actinomycetes bacterium]